MENLKEQRGHDAAGGNNAWMTVPAFGDWDMKNGALPDYSMDFSKIREMRKQNKKELSRASLGGDDDLLAHAQAQKPRRDQPQPNNAQPKLGRPRPADDHRRRPLHARDHSPTKFVDSGREEVPELLPVLYQGLKRSCCSAA
ncbi:unnamed protein product [Miscanthus lutarioriparius]|uniref:RIN4 pathogenic type III effector avirulence factor Avr cleavage site domain-containing protein n=1 Tax=Miscanthus lutarioriparius TaxID=422564 RepID=A0A811M6G9_9POAL|nr:unnamed protein product [Miscanthus lutarioriparius]